MTTYAQPRTAAAALGLALLLGACTGSTEDDRPEAGATPTSSPTPATSATPSPTPTPTPEPSPTGPEPIPAEDPISMGALAASDLRGDRLRLGAVRERTADYVSRDVTFRSSGFGPDVQISGVLNVPTGRGPFPAVVLAHGYIDPAIYERGQGMTRERGSLAAAGFVTLHVDYRNHAESGRDGRVDSAIRLGYTADVINGVSALKAADLPVDDERVAMFGRSMGGGVVHRALAVRPGLTAAGVTWASVSSLEAENYRQFIAQDSGRSVVRDRMAARHGLPDDNPEFWRAVSPRPYFDRVTEPVLNVHGRRDETCPPRWAVATERALQRAGVESTLAWYDDMHAFGPAYDAAMRRTIGFLRDRMGA